MEGRSRAALNAALVRLADGDRAAFDAVFDLAEPEVRRLVGRLVPAPDADDVAQQALLNVFARAGEFDGERDALAWILGIAAYEARTVSKRARRRREELGADVRDVPAAGSPEEAALER